jgi:hypothetical protein
MTSAPKLLKVIFVLLLGRLGLQLECSTSQSHNWSQFFYAGLLRWDDTELALLQGSPWMLVAGQGSS